MAQASSRGEARAGLLIAVRVQPSPFASGTEHASAAHSQALTSIFSSYGLSAGDFMFRTLVFDYREPAFGSYPVELILALPVARPMKAVGWAADWLRAAKGVGEARSLVNAARLRGQLVGKEIAGGHAFEKHVLNQGEFKGVGIRTRDQFASHIENVVNNPTASRQLSGGRSAYWQESTGTVVIRNPRAADGGTALQPTNGRAYFDGLR